MIKSRRVRWLAWERKKNAYKVLVAKPEEKRPLREGLAGR
jgi:hypothetical protein